MRYQFPKPCLDCGVLTTGSTRCARCLDKKNQTPLAIKRQQARKAHQRLMYGNDYKQRRAEVISESTHCGICKQPFVLGDMVEADHIVPHHLSELQAVHRLCNQKKGNKTS